MTEFVLTSDEEFEALKSDWDALHEEAQGNLFQSFDWLFSWWRVYRDTIRMALLILRDGDHLVGIVPFFVEVKSTAGLKLRRLRMMGELEISGEYEPLVLGSSLEEVAGAASNLLLRLLRDGEIDVADFHHFPTESTFFSKLSLHVRRGGAYVRWERRSTVHLVLRPPHDWRTYFRSLARNDRHLRARHERVLLKNGVEIEALAGIDDPQVFEDFVRLHSGAMAARSVRGHFVSKDRFGEFLKRVSATPGPSVRACWFFLKKEETRFAALLAFYSRDGCSLYLTGRDPSHALARYGPGIVLMNHVIRDAINRKCSTVDLGEGGTPYKFTMGAKDEGFGRMTITRGGILRPNVALYLLVVAFHHRDLWTKRLEPLVQKWRFKLSSRRSQNPIR